VRLAGDRGVDYGEVAKVLDMLASLKLQKVSLRTKPAK
jgi:biopolymer transport protein ExbD